MTKESIPNYSQDYIESCFYVWYRDRDQHKLIFEGDLPVSETGSKPNYQTVRTWRDKYGWLERADALDAEVAVKLEKEAVSRKAEAIKKLAGVGENLVDQGLSYIKKEGFDSASAAVRAVIGGADMMSRFVGMGELLLGMSKMNDQQLNKEFYRLLGKDDDTVEAEIIQDEDAADKSEDDNS